MDMMRPLSLITLLIRAGTNLMTTLSLQSMRCHITPKLSTTFVVLELELLGKCST
tara:strand:+ start:327 stop:491 length:165 start_codon:yes stop_codon:yes gene_type:complete